MAVLRFSKRTMPHVLHSLDLENNLFVDTVRTNDGKWYLQKVEHHFVLYHHQFQSFHLFSQHNSSLWYTIVWKIVKSEKSIEFTAQLRSVEKKRARDEMKLINLSMALPLQLLLNEAQFHLQFNYLQLSSSLATSDSSTSAFSLAAQWGKLKKKM